MKLKNYTIIAAAALFALINASCDDKVTAEEASKAGEILKKWQDQNK